MSTSRRGRFAPSPTGRLHLGNLRTALASWLHSRSGGGEWIVRMEDLDPVTSSRAHAADQLTTLERLGLTWDGPVVFQSERFDRYRAALDDLRARGLVYECYCSRREIRAAASAPHGELPGGAYPGTCRHLADADRRRRRTEGRRPALRLRAAGESIEVDDLVVGRVCGTADDVVLERNDGVPAYNLAVVVDDAAQGVTDVVRGDDLLSSVPRQVLLQRLLGLPTPTYVHVPMVLGSDGARLAKRHGAVTLPELEAAGLTPGRVLARLGASLGCGAGEAEVTASDLLAAFDVRRIPREPLRW